MINLEVTLEMDIMDSEEDLASYQVIMDRMRIDTLIKQLSNTETREYAILELNSKREEVPDLAEKLWISPNIDHLLEEIETGLPTLDTEILTLCQSNRIRNAVALLQCVASNPETKLRFLEAQIPSSHLYPFLNTIIKTEPFELLRLTILGVVATVVTMQEQEAIAFILTSKLIPICLNVMENDSELNKTLATYIFLQILLYDLGLAFICQTTHRFNHVAHALEEIVISLIQNPSEVLLNYVIKCYLRLSDHPMAHQELQIYLPQQLRDNTFSRCICENASIYFWLTELLTVLENEPQNSLTELEKQRLEWENVCS